MHRVEPAAGTPWVRVPYSVGHVVEPVSSQGLELRACPVLARPEAGQLVLAAGRLMDTAGWDWLRIEFRQMILWILADTNIRISIAGRVRSVSVQTAGYRSCERVVMFPRPTPSARSLPTDVSWIPMYSMRAAVCPLRYSVTP